MKQPFFLSFTEDSDIAPDVFASIQVCLLAGFSGSKNPHNSPVLSIYCGFDRVPGSNTANRRYEKGGVEGLSDPKED